MPPGTWTRWKLHVVLALLPPLVTPRQQLLQQQRPHFSDGSPILKLRADTDASATSDFYVRAAWELTDSSGLFPFATEGQGGGKLFVDVGLEIGSGLLCMLRNNPHLYVLGLEAHPINFGISYTNTLSMLEQTKMPGNGNTSHAVVLPLGAANHSGTVTFYESHAPACGSLLKSTKMAWWCAQTRDTRVIPVVRLDAILSRIPPELDFFYLKVDAEGADHLVLHGAGHHISRFQMASIECRAANNSHGDLSREGSCNRIDTVAWMKSKGFAHHVCTDFDCHFARPSAAALDVAVMLQKIAGLPGRTDCVVDFPKSIWNTTWDQMTWSPRRRRQLLADVDMAAAAAVAAAAGGGRGRRGPSPWRRAYADALIAQAAGASGPTQPDATRHRRRALSHAADAPPVTAVFPLTTYSAADANAEANVTSRRTKITLLSKITHGGQFLKLPIEGRNALIVAVGSKVGSGLVCLLAEHPELSFLGLEPHPVHYAIASHNTLREFAYPTRAVFLPLGAGNRTGAMMLKQRWSVGCDDTLAAWPRPKNNESYNDGPPPSPWSQRCYTMPATRLVLPFVRLGDFIPAHLPSNYSLHYLAVSVDGGPDGPHFLPRPLEVLHGAGAPLLRRFAMLSFDCPTRGLAQEGPDCGTALSAAVSKKDRSPSQRDLWATIAYLTHEEVGFKHWKCSGRGCHFGRVKEDVVLAAYYHRIQALPTNAILKMWPNKWGEARRGKCRDEEYHEPVMWGLKAGLASRNLHAVQF